MFWTGLTMLAIGAFVEITKELVEGEVDVIDGAILLAIASARRSWLTIAAVDLTALGSITVIALLSIFVLVALLILRDRTGALQLLSASTGAAIWTAISKNLMERSRPATLPALIEVSGFSYPSGHSLAASSVYLTIAILVCAHVRSTRLRVAVIGMAGFIVVLIGWSRIYLGVHYPSDVAAGVALGGSWAFLLAGAFSFMDNHDAHGRRFEYPARPEK